MQRHLRLSARLSANFEAERDSAEHLNLAQPAARRSFCVQTSTRVSTAGWQQNSEELFVPQSDHWVDFRCPARWKITSQEMALLRTAFRQLGRERQEKPRFRGEEAKVRRQHANDLSWHSVHTDFPSEDVLIGIKALAPVGVAQDGHSAVSTGVIVSLSVKLRPITGPTPSVVKIPVRRA